LIYTSEENYIIGVVKSVDYVRHMNANIIRSSWTDMVLPIIYSAK